MSRRDGIENLLGVTASHAAPTVTEMKKQTADDAGVAPPADVTSEPNAETSEPIPSRPGKRRSADPALVKDRKQIRFQVSAPVGSDVEQALMDALRDIPEPLRSGVNVGRLFRTVLIENDEAIALMIRKQLSEG